MNFQTIIKDIEGIPADIIHLFTSPAAEAAIKEAATLAIAAQPYVVGVEAAITPLLGPAGELTEAAVNAAYAKYVVPMANVALNTPAQLGNALLNLTTGLLQKNNAPTASITVLNTAVQLAKLAVSATAAPAPSAA